MWGRRSASFRIAPRAPCVFTQLDVRSHHGDGLYQHPWSVSHALFFATRAHPAPDLSLDARIKYVSDSVEDILGYLPPEVKGKSCWEYFHPDEVPFARAIFGRGIQLDKAAQLNYCRVKHKDGTWIGCECVFTIVYDVIVASTSIYRRSLRSRREYKTLWTVVHPDFLARTRHRGSCHSTYLLVISP